MVLMSIIQQLRYSRKDVRKIFTEQENEDEIVENTDNQLLQPTKT